MKLIASATALAAAALLAGCEMESTGPACEQLQTQRSSTSGDTVTTVTGLRYLETRVGTGVEVRSCDAVLVRYSGRVIATEAAFDSGQFAFSPGFGFQRAIPGFEQGVVGMRVGGARRLIIPPALGYRDVPQTDPRTGQVVIPANSTLVFDVEVVEVAQR